MSRSLSANACRRTGLTLAIWLLAAVAVCAQAADNRLESIQTTALGGGRAEIILTLTGPAPKPAVFEVTQPAQLSIDLPQTTLDTDHRYRSVQAGPVTGLTVAADHQRTRLVVRLTQPVNHEVQRDGNKIHIIVSPRDQAAHEQTVSNGNRVTHVDFRRSANGAGKVQITLRKAGTAINTRQHDGNVLATLANTELPEQLHKRLDVLDFATPVKYVDIYARNGNTEIVVTPVDHAKFKRTAYQSGNEYTLELKPIKESPEADKAEVDTKPKFTGKKISLSFQKIDVRSVLQIIADVANVNMVVSDNVSGQITLQLDDVPWDQALNIILKSQGLGMRRIGNVINVAPLAQIAQRKKAEQEANQATENAVPLQSQIIQINYADAAEIAKLIRDTGSGQTAMISDRGQVSVDQRTNSLLVTDTEAKLQVIRQVVSRLDIPVRQVLIESRIVVANRDFSRELGVTQEVTRGSDASTGTASELNNNGFTVNLPVAQPAGTLTASIISNTFSLNLALSAMETENEGEIISSPRVITTDGQQALIKQGQEVPYTTQQGRDNPATTEFKEVVLELNVTPHITPDEHVLLDMDLTQDNVNGYSPNGEPVIDTRNVKTQVLVDDGNTVVLGGIYQQQNNNTRNKVPILGDLPLVGALFSGSQRQRKKQELLIFITPEILQETLTEH